MAKKGKKEEKGEKETLYHLRRGVGRKKKR